MASSPYLTNGVSVKGAYFDGGTPSSATQIDIDVTGGVGHYVSGNYYNRIPGSRETGYAVRLASHSSGILVRDTSIDITPNGIEDYSAGGWLINSSNVWNGLILKSPSGTVCSRISIDNSGNLVAAAATCP